MCLEVEIHGPKAASIQCPYTFPNASPMGEGPPKPHREFAQPDWDRSNPRTTRSHQLVSCELTRIPLIHLMPHMPVGILA